MKKKYLKKNKGFTIIETMIAISLFLVVIMIGVGTLLNASLLHAKSQNMRSIIDNLSFIMEDMSKNLRTGYDYHCIDDGNVTASNPHSCATGAGISFKTTLGDQWVYVILSDGSIQKSVSGGAAGTFTMLTPPEIKINLASGFSVVGAEPPLGDTRQPFVIIRLIGTITYKSVVTPFSLQTSISQRSVDVVL